MRYCTKKKYWAIREYLSYK